MTIANVTWFTVTVAFSTDSEKDAFVFNTNDYSSIGSLINLVYEGGPVMDSDGHVYRFNKDKIFFVEVYDATEYLGEDY